MLTSGQVLNVFIHHLHEMDQIYCDPVPGLPTSKCRIRPKGWVKLDDLSKNNSNNSQGFVAMWFSKDMEEVYEQGIALGISDAGYIAHRVDLREHNGKIDDEIITQIRRSKFVVADFTGHRGGVYYEAGFAKGLGLEVFWLCEDKDMENLHFDIRQYNCIVWSRSNLQDLRKKVAYRIESVLGAGSRLH